MDNKLVMKLFSISLDGWWYHGGPVRDTGLGTTWDYVSRDRFSETDREGVPVSEFEGAIPMVLSKMLGHRLSILESAELWHFSSAERSGLVLADDELDASIWLEIQGIDGAELRRIEKADDLPSGLPAPVHTSLPAWYTEKVFVQEVRRVFRVMWDVDFAPPFPLHKWEDCVVWPGDYHPEHPNEVGFSGVVKMGPYEAHIEGSIFGPDITTKGDPDFPVWSQEKVECRRPERWHIYAEED